MLLLHSPYPLSYVCQCVKDFRIILGMWFKILYNVLSVDARDNSIIGLSFPDCREEHINENGL